MPELIPPLSESMEPLKTKDVLNRDTVILMGTYLIFQLSNVSFNSLYPIFAQANAPTGRQLNPQEIGLSLAFAGVVTIIFQVGIFGKLRDKMGNRWAYRVSLAGFAASFLLMPWVTYKKNGQVLLWLEIGAVLLVKTVAAVGGLTSALLLVSPCEQHCHSLADLDRSRTPRLITLS
jgi:MFS family permease